VRREVAVPLTVKFRLGLDERRVNYLELGRICEGEGADGVVLHARTARQMFRGEAAWEHVARLKESVTIPVIGNGDVRTPEDAARMLRQTGCDGVMIGPRRDAATPGSSARTAALLSGGAARRRASPSGGRSCSTTLPPLWRASRAPWRSTSCAPSLASTATASRW
jgi:tRNA-dihydrouridine synthase